MLYVLQDKPSNESFGVVVRLELQPLVKRKDYTRRTPSPLSYQNLHLYCPSTRTRWYLTETLAPFLVTCKDSETKKKKKKNVILDI